MRLMLLTAAPRCVSHSETSAKYYERELLLSQSCETPELITNTQLSKIDVAQRTLISGQPLRAIILLTCSPSNLTC